MQPRLAKLLDGLTGKAESYVEKASDLIAKAREGLSDETSHVGGNGSEKMM